MLYNRLSSEGIMITKQKSKHDKFYTKESVVISLLPHVDFSRYKTVIEPSAGAGAFSTLLPHDNVIAMDIAPEHESISQQDWLNFKLNNIDSPALIIGNPPFGLRNALSKAFIEKSLHENVLTIAFILPNVFNKFTNQKVFPEEWSLSKVIPLPKESFLLNDESYHVPCSFFIWERESNGINLRAQKSEMMNVCDDFMFVRQRQGPNAFIMGAAPKTIKDLQDIEPNNRGYYIKSLIPVDRLREKMACIEWKKYGNSSAKGGVSWFSKDEIIKIYSQIHC